MLGEPERFETKTLSGTGKLDRTNCLIRWEDFNTDQHLCDSSALPIRREQSPSLT